MKLSKKFVLWGTYIELGINCGTLLKDLALMGSYRTKCIFQTLCKVITLWDYIYIVLLITVGIYIYKFWRLLIQDKYGNSFMVTVVGGKQFYFNAIYYSDHDTVAVFILDE